MSSHGCNLLLLVHLTNLGGIPDIICIQQIWLTKKRSANCLTASIFMENSKPYETVHHMDEISSCWYISSIWAEYFSLTTCRFTWKLWHKIIVRLQVWKILMSPYSRIVNRDLPCLVYLYEDADEEYLECGSELTPQLGLYICIFIYLYIWWGIPWVWEWVLRQRGWSRSARADTSSHGQPCSAPW